MELPASKRDQLASAGNTVLSLRLGAAARFVTFAVATWCGAQVLGAAPAENETADLILHHGQVVTVDPGFAIVQALAARGQHVVGAALGRYFLTRSSVYR